MKKSLIALLVLIFNGASIAFASSVSITSVAAQQRYPWNGKVDVMVELQGSADDVASTVCAFVATNGVAMTAIPISHISQNGSDKGSDTTWTRSFVWDATADLGAVKIDDIELTVHAVDVGGVQLWENGPFWAECNVGATQPEGSGFYFWWGCRYGGYVPTSGQSNWKVYNDTSSLYYSPFDSSWNTLYNIGKDELLSCGYIDSSGNLAAEYDAATLALGAPWRMPTKDEFDDLVNNCVSVWTNLNGMCGRLVTGKGAYASRSVFFPAAGHGAGTSLYSSGTGGFYWSSTPKGDSRFAWTLGFGTYTDGTSFMYVFGNNGENYRYSGNSVRPLRDLKSVILPEYTSGGSSCSTQLRFDNVTRVRELPIDGERLFYDVNWYEDGDEIEIRDNGDVVMIGTAGSYAWYPRSSRTLHNLELNILSNGVVIGTETAQFTLGYIRNVSVRQLWPHGKMEVSYEVAEDICEACQMDSHIQLKMDSGNGASSTPEMILGEGWHIVTDTYDEGTYSYRAWPETFFTRMDTKLNGASKIEFNWRSVGNYASAKMGEDGDWIYVAPCFQLAVYIDGKKKSGIDNWPSPGGCGWSHVCFALDSSKSHVVMWDFAYQNWGQPGYSDLCNMGFVADVTVTYVVENAVTIIGDDGVAPGFHRVIWDMDSDRVKHKQIDAGFVVSIDNIASNSGMARIDTSTDLQETGCDALDCVLGYSPVMNGKVEVCIDGTIMVSSTNSGEFAWQPKRLGEHTITHMVGTNVWTKIVNVTNLNFATQKDPDPPGAVDETITLGLDNKTFTSAARKPCMFAVSSTVDGHEWNASVSDDWLTLTKTSGVCGTDKVTYYAEANTNAAERTGYVYISGHVHTVVQPGVGANLQVADPLVFDCEGTAQTVVVEADEGVHWDVLPKAEWITIQSTSGDATGTVTLCAAPFVCVGSRTGTAIIAGKEVTFTQNGCDMQLSHYVTNCTKSAVSMNVGIKANADKSWSVAPQVGWISIVGSASGVGDGEIVLSVEENSGHLTRTGFVTIGTETFKVVQEPSAPHVSSTCIDCESSASEISVEVFTDLYNRWSISNTLDWVECSGDVSRVGPGTVVLSVAANTSITARTGVVVIAGFEIAINQAASDVAISPSEVSIASAGEEFDIDVSAPYYLQWQIGTLPAWVSLAGESMRTGSATLTFTVAANTGVDGRKCEIAIGEKTLKVCQQAASVAVDVDRVVYGVDSDFGRISATAADYLTWNVSTSNDWIEFSSATEFTGSGEVEYIYGDIGLHESRIGIIWAGNTPVYVCQCGFETSLDIESRTVPRLSGIGQIGVDVEDGADEWCAMSTVPWIKVETTSGTGDGIVQYSYDANTTRVERVGRILVCDQVFTLTQTDADPSIPRWQIAYENLQGATHVNPNHYDEGDVYTFTAPTGGRTGYTFAGWNPAGIAADDTGDKTVRASWTANSYTVAFDANGGSGEMANQTFVYDEAKALTECAFTRTEYSFSGWSTHDGAGSVDLADGAVVSNLTATAGGYVTLRAVWKSESKTLPVSGTAFHLDASDESTLTMITENGTNFVSRWNDASGGDRYAYADGHKPFIEKFHGKSTLNFGAIRMNIKNNEYGDSAWMKWSAEDTSIREIFIVLRDNVCPGAEEGNRAFILSHTGNYQFHRGDVSSSSTEKGRSLFSAANASALIKNGKIQVDDEDVSFDYELPDGYHIIRVQTTEAVAANAFCLDRTCRFGGQNIAEVVIYDSPLSEDDAEKVCDYLYDKWFDATNWQISYTNLHGAKHANPDLYYKGEELVFTAPTSGRTNFTFAGWSPTGITAGTTGDQVVTANWSWMPSDAVVAAEITGSKPVSIPSNWVKVELPSRFGVGKDVAFCETFGADLAAALTKSTGKRDGAGNELSVWHDYVAGTDPTDSNSVFKAKLTMNGISPIIEWEPNLNTNGEERVYTIWGKTNLLDTAWHTPTNECSHFFKVDVAMPSDGTVTFDLGGATGSVASRNIRVGNPIGELPTPTRAGYEFLGWFTAAEGGAEVTADTVVADDMQIYAQWKVVLLHRWSFNGNLSDSVGGVTAQYLGSASIAWTSDNKAIALEGGVRGTSGVDLGPNLLPTNGTPITIEIWAKGRAIRGSCNRVFEIGNDKKDSLQLMWWTNPTTLSEAQLRNEDTIVSGGYATWNAFEVGKEYHVVVRIEPHDESTTIYIARRYASADNDIEEIVWTIGDGWNLSDLQQDVFYLGRSLWSDNDSAADYNEVRIWNCALTDEELTASVLAGPDADL